MQPIVVGNREHVETVATKDLPPPAVAAMDHCVATKVAEVLGSVHLHLALGRNCETLLRLE